MTALLPVSLEFAHTNLGWPAPDAILAPGGEGARVIVGLAKTKIGRALSAFPDGRDAKVGVLLRNPEANATDAPLGIVVQFAGMASEQTLRELQRLAWNFSHSPTVITIEPNLLRIWSCCAPPDNKRPLSDYLVHELGAPDLLERETQPLGRRAAQALHWANLVSGQFFQEREELFDRDQRADQLLLGNLLHVRSLLQSAGLTDDDVCHDLLARVIFVQFLFDRRDSEGNAALTATKLARLYETGILAKRHDGFSSILGNYDDTYRLFEWLNTKFNGDLFPAKGDTPEEREAGWRTEKSLVTRKHLALLRDFVSGQIDMPAGQACLWPLYSFDVIPLEFVSSIYETFVTERAAKEGIYYTPPHLVDFVLDRVLPWNSDEWNLRILDPACGSGIFLVKAFQRLIYRWKRAHPGQLMKAEALRSLLENNLFGVDKDPHAVRVASFSLYLAMCDEIDPKHYWSQVVFPPMRGRRLINSDFFCEESKGFRSGADAGCYDLVIGNAPWGEKLLTEPAKKWAKRKERVWPLANKGIGTLFLPKAASLTSPIGKVAMIQSASSLLFNRAGPAYDFRNQFFSSFRVEQVINLSALRFKVFKRKTHSTKTSVAPSCIVIFSPAPADPYEKVCYISPKHADNLADEFDIVVEPHDVKYLSVADAASDPVAWTALMWGNSRDRSFINRLRSFRTIKDPGIGFEVKKREGIIRGDRKKTQPNLVGRRILSERDFPPGQKLYLDAENLDINNNGETDSRASTDFSAFAQPQLIVKQGWRKAISRFQARLFKSNNQQGALCTQSYITISASNGDNALIEAACLSYNSMFATYFLLLTSSRFASYRPEPLVDELLQVPIPEPRKGMLDNLGDWDDIDQRLATEFGFKDAERALIEDLFEYTLPDFQGVENSKGKKRTSRSHGETQEPFLRQYAEYFIRVLRAGFGADKRITATIFQEADHPLPYRIVAFELEREEKETVQVSSFGTTELYQELERLNAEWLRQSKSRSGSVYYQRVARIYDYSGEYPTIFVIKPDANRYWTRSMGLQDGDEVALDFLRWHSAQMNSGRSE